MFRAENDRFTSHTADQYRVFIKEQIDKWTPLVKASGARAD